MADISAWSATAASNTLSSGTAGSGGTNIDEGMAPSAVNNAMRDIMARLTAWRTAAYFGSATNQQALVGAGTITPAVQVRGTTNNNSGALLATFSATASTGPRLDFYRSKDAAIDTATVVASGDRLGTIAFFGAQQTGTLSNQVAGVSIRAEVDGVVTSGAAGDMPGRLIIATTPDGSGTTTDRLTINSAGLVTLANDLTVTGQIQAGVSTNATEQASTSGTSIDFTSIPSWAKRITIMFVGVSTNGTSDIIVQLGDSGGIETSGYLGSGTTLSGSAVAMSTYTAGFGVARSPIATNLINGRIDISLEDASDFTWVESGILGCSDAATNFISAGSKATSAALDRVRITTAGGVNTFDAGVINIQYSS